jgi:four helix bundle protein
VQVNIAEGFERFAPRDFHRFLTIAKGSLAEVRALLIVAVDRKYLDPATHEFLASQAEILAKRLSHLMKHLRRSKPR